MKTRTTLIILSLVLLANGYAWGQDEPRPRIILRQSVLDTESLGNTALWCEDRREEIREAFDMNALRASELTKQAEEASEKFFDGKAVRWTVKVYSIGEDYVRIVPPNKWRVGFDVADSKTGHNPTADSSLNIPDEISRDLALSLNRGDLLVIAAKVRRISFQDFSSLIQIYEVRAIKIADEDLPQ